GISLCDCSNLKIAIVILSLASFFSAFVIAFVKSWKFALILSCIVPAIIAVFGVGGGFMAKYAKLAMQEYSTASTIAEEIISSVRTAQAFGTQDKLAKLYDDNLITAQHAEYKQQFSGAMMLAVMLFSVYAFYGLGFCMFWLDKTDYKRREDDYLLLEIWTPASYSLFYLLLLSMCFHLDHLV